MEVVILKGEAIEAWHPHYSATDLIRLITEYIRTVLKRYYENRQSITLMRKGTCNRIRHESIYSREWLVSAWITAPFLLDLKIHISSSYTTSILVSPLYLLMSVEYFFLIYIILNLPRHSLLVRPFPGCAPFLSSAFRSQHHCVYFTNMFC